MRQISLAPVGTLLLLFTACASAPVGGRTTASNLNGAAVPLVGAYQAHRFALANGLQLIVVEDHSSPTIAYQTWFRVGSRDERVNYTGLAHLFEHMMFKGTKNLKDGEFDRSLEAAGAEGLNAFTSRDYTAYIQEMPKDKLELIASLEAERMVNLIVTEETFRTETDVVKNERRFRTENNPDGTLDEILFETAFTKHSYRWPIVGYQKDLERMHAPDAVEFYRSHYSPNNATVVVVGDVSPREVLATVQKHYGSLPSQPLPASTVEAEPPQKSARHRTLKLTIQTDKLMMGYRMPEMLHEDLPALTMLQSVLSIGKSSRLRRALVDTGIAANLEAYQQDDKDPSLFTFFVNLQQGKKAAHAEAIILRELTRLQQQPLSSEEFEKARNQLNSFMLQSFEGNYGKAQFIGKYETLMGDFTRGADLFRKSLQVTPADLQAVAKRYFDPSNRTAITGIPNEKK